VDWAAEAGLLRKRDGVCDQHETQALSIYSVRSEGAQKIDGGSRGKYWQMRRKFCMGADVHRYLTTGLGLGAA
jgi:hypothetical protein